ncbi:hypothetical protein [Aeromonas caviae]|uniref:hypothetical protein n=1 Tax=Aeromonas caviae TaxID=648 RepID=UPI002B46040C|nr:hypothetical protein [Aeromonas caviae]
MQNVPIGTAMPYCVKWESSSLGGCEVGCSGVCVETPATGTMGPIYSSGVECSMGGGGDGGGDTGGSPGGDGSLPGDTDNIAGWQYFNHYGYETVGYTLSKINANLGKQFTGVNSRLSNSNHFLNEIAGNTFDASRQIHTTNDILAEALPYIKETSGRIEGTNLYLSRMEADFDLANAQLKKIADNIGSLDGGGSGGSDLGTLPGDAAAIKGMMQTAMGWWGGTPGNLTAISGQLTGISNSVAPMFPMLEHFNKQQTSLQTQMAGDLAAIKSALGNGQGSGGSGNEGGADIDYSKMPGAADNPLHVAGSNYESNLCQEGDNCALDLGKINKQYDDKKTELKDKYGAIRDDVSQVFKFQFSGSASAPKCFDMFSIFGKSYQVCPDSDGYWDFLAALMMFIFYFTAFIVLTRR